jgi:hypothetical protein
MWKLKIANIVKSTNVQETTIFDLRALGDIDFPYWKSIQHFKQSGQACLITKSDNGQFQFIKANADVQSGYEEYELNMHISRTRYAHLFIQPLGYFVAADFAIESKSITFGTCSVIVFPWVPSYSIKYLLRNKQLLSSDRIPHSIYISAIMELQTGFKFLSEEEGLVYNDLHSGQVVMLPNGTFKFVDLGNSYIVDSRGHRIIGSTRAQSLNTQFFNLSAVLFDIARVIPLERVERKELRKKIRESLL